MRLLLVGAFPFPHHQGSQVYFREQARALHTAGAAVELLTYGSRSPAAPSPGSIDVAIPHHRTPGWSSPRSLASGPDWAKPVADLSLAMTLRRLIASSMRHDRTYDAVLTHHAEAALAALLALPRRPRPALVYCAHTLLEHELPLYMAYGAPEEDRFEGGDQAGSSSSKRSHAARGLARRVGRGVDGFAARHTDGWITLTQSSERVIDFDAPGPGQRIGPPLTDPQPTLRPEEIGATCLRHGLRPGRFVVYSGNLDGYQDLPRLAQACAGRGPDEVVIASHDPEVETAARLPDRLARRFVRDEREMLALMAGARASLVPRTSPGGYPIKLANSLALGVPPITIQGSEWRLVHGENAWVASGRGPTGLAEGVTRLLSDEDLAARLGRGARALYEQHLEPGRVAQGTLVQIERAIAFAGSPAADPTRQLAGSVSPAPAGDSLGRPSSAFTESTKPSASSKRSATG